MRAYKRYRGIGIFIEKEVVVGSDFDILSDGRTVERKPKYINWYRQVDGARNHTVKEVKKEIDDWISEVQLTCEVDEKEAIALCVQCEKDDIAHYYESDCSAWAERP
jgi:hypothetical protein